MTRPRLIVGLVGLVGLVACGRLNFAVPAHDDAGPRDGAASNDATADASATGDGSGLSDGVAVIDARIVTAVPDTGCFSVAAGQGTAFPGGSPCSDWAANVATTNASIAESSGLLTITPNANAAGALGQCSRSVMFDGPGVFVEVVAVLTSPMSITTLEVQGGGNYNLVVRDGNLLAQDVGSAGTIASAPYVPSAMRWLRIRPVTGMVLFEYSADASAWVRFAMTTHTAPEMVTAVVLGGEGSAAPSPGVAQFAHLGVCP